MLLSDVVATTAQVSGTSSRLAKTEALAALLSRLGPAEVPVAVGLLVGSPRQGRLGVGWRGIAALEVDPRMTRIGPVCVCGGEAAFQFRIDIDLGGTKIKMTSTDVMTFDADGKITSMRAFADAEADPDQ